MPARLTGCSSVPTNGSPRQGQVGAARLQRAYKHPIEQHSVANPSALAAHGNTNLTSPKRRDRFCRSARQRGIASEVSVACGKAHRQGVEQSRPSSHVCNVRACPKSFNRLVKNNDERERAASVAGDLSEKCDALRPGSVAPGSLLPGACALGVGELDDPQQP
jgi:hypothetical protein